jgi:hypothetical protein
MARGKSSTGGGGGGALGPRNLIETDADRSNGLLAPPQVGRDELLVRIISTIVLCTINHRRRRFGPRNASLRAATANFLPPPLAKPAFNQTGSPNLIN